MEYKVGDYYTKTDQKEEIEQLKDGQKYFFAARKIRKSGSASAAEQSKQIQIIASYNDAMKNDFNENEEFKKIYRKFAPRLLEDFEKSDAPPKKEKKEKKNKETEAQLKKLEKRYSKD